MVLLELESSPLLRGSGAYMFDVNTVSVCCGAAF